MNSTFLYENEKEEKLHLNAIRSIAKETGFPEDDVGLVYETALEKREDTPKSRLFTHSGKERGKRDAIEIDRTRPRRSFHVIAYDIVHHIRWPYKIKGAFHKKTYRC